MTSLREEERKRGGEGGKGMSHTTGHDLHSNPQWCHGQPGVLRAQTGVPSCSWVSRGRVWESPQLACSGERRRQWQLRQSRWKRRGWGRKDGGEGEERGVTCRMETACTDKQISIGVCVCVWVGVLCVQLVRPRLAALSCGCTLLLRVESIGACFRDDRGEWYEERGPLLPPPPPPELPHVLTAPVACGLQPSIFIFSTVSTVVLSVCSPRLPVFVMAGCELGNNACQCCFFFLLLLFFWKLQGENGERGKRLRRRRKTVLQETSGHGVRHNARATGNRGITSTGTVAR